MKALIYSLFFLISLTSLGQDEELSDVKLRKSYICYDLNLAVSKPDTVIGLNIRKQGYKEIPASIGKLHKLEYINAMKNEIAVISPEIGQLRALKILNVSQNKISELPDPLFKLKKLGE